MNQDEPFIGEKSIDPEWPDMAEKAAKDKHERDLKEAAHIKIAKQSYDELMAKRMKIRPPKK